MNAPKTSISLKEIKDMLTGKEPNVQLVDVRSKEEYDKHHVPEALNLSAEELKSTIDDEDSKSKTIVTICNHGNQRSQSAAQLLRDLGFKNAYFLEGGTAGWFEEMDGNSNI